jgi:hypothetical protein
MSGARPGSVRGWGALCLSVVVVLLALPGQAQDAADPAGKEPGSIGVARVLTALDAITSHTPPDFCRRDHRLERREAALCSLGPAARARCPEFAAACERMAGGAPQPPAEARRATESRWLGLLAGVLQMIGLALLAGLAALCVLALVRLVRGHAAARRREPAEDATTPGSGGATVDVEREGGPEPHLARARALAAAGEFPRALVELHLGVLSSLDARGVLRARPGRTNGDYARELGQKPELLSAFREVTRAVEAVQFGGARLDASGFQRLLGRAAPLLPALALLVGLSFGAFGCGGEPAKPAASEACGSGADGHSLLCGVLEATGARVRRRYRSLEGLADASSDVNVVVLLRGELEAKSTRALEAWVRSGGVLVLTAPLPELDGQLGVERSERPCGGEATFGRSARLATIGPGLLAPQLEAWAVCLSGDAFIARGLYGDGRVAVLPTPAALSNASLAAGDNAMVLVPLLFPADAVVELVGSWTRDEAENPLGQLRAAGLLPWLLQLMALGLCYGLYRGQPFARRRAPPEVGRRRFSEHAQALGQRWAEAGAAGSALKAYATWATEQLRERLPIGTEQTVAGLAQVISEKTGKPPEAVARTLERARQAQVGPEPRPVVSFGQPLPPRELPDEAEQLSTLKSLGRLLEEIGGSR